MQHASIDFSHGNRAARSSCLTYEPFYGLKEKPFSLSADPRFLYKSHTHGPVFDELREGIRRREGIIVLTGEPGTGKTTICRGVVESLDRKTFCAFVPDPFLSREDLLKVLLIEFGVMSVDELKSGRLRAASRPELSYPLYDFLRSLVPLQAYAVLIVDEAQNLTSHLLEEIRILSDLEGPDKLLQLVLVGQPELRDKLKDSTLRQVDQRVSVRSALQPIERETLPGYIAHRLTVAGAGSNRVEFAPAALDVLYDTSNGNPRALNLIADKALHRGHLDGTWIISADIVTAALVDLGRTDPAPEKFAPEPPEPAPISDESFPPPVPTAPPVTSLDRAELHDGLHQFLEEAFIEEARMSQPAAVYQVPRHGVRRAAIMTTLALVIVAVLVGWSEWELLRRELAQPLPRPALPSAPAHRISAGVAPVVPPPEFLAPVLP